MAQVHCFSYADFDALIKAYAPRLLSVLASHAQTTPLALELEQLQPAQALVERFTIAVIGQMRSGKSTLLNALLNRDLAPVGINETTATINWFQHTDQPELLDRFRVHWLDGRTEDFPHTQLEQFIGQAKQVENIRKLEFFSDSEFLKTAFLVDTPGTRSVLESHASAIDGFLAEKLEEQSLRYGGRADALIYVINPVVRENDRDLLLFFDEQTRFPGASVYNSVAVMQKWESLEEPDPLAAALAKCERMRTELKGCVAEVFPVSGMLAIMARKQSIEVWDRIARLAVASSEEAFMELTMLDTYFAESVDGAALDVPTRQELLARLPWPGLKFCLKHARLHRLGDGTTLRNAIHVASGLDRLNAVLERRILKLAGLIKAGAVLRKTWAYSHRGVLELRQIQSRRRDDLNLADQSMSLLNGPDGQRPSLAAVRDYVLRSQQSLMDDCQRIASSLETLDRIQIEASDNFGFLDRDILGLERLPLLRQEAVLNDVEYAELHRLFGGLGLETEGQNGLSTRLGIAPSNDAVGLAGERLGFWQQRQPLANARAKPVFEHAVECYERILDSLEQT